LEQKSGIVLPIAAQYLNANSPNHVQILELPFETQQFFFTVSADRLMIFNSSSKDYLAVWHRTAEFFNCIFTYLRAFEA